MNDTARQFLLPKACPVELVRIGGSGDGAYLLPDDLDGVSACFSPGVNNFKWFEDELCERWAMQCHLCDFSSDLEKFATPLISGLQTFEKKWLDVTNAPDAISLPEWVQQRAPEPDSDLIMQMDIEGAEYPNLLAADRKLLQRFRVIVVELHGLQALTEGGDLKQHIESLLLKLDDTHVCVHAHPNNCCGQVIDLETGLNLPRVIELTLLRKDRFQGDSSSWFQPQLPHPLDVDFNVPHNPPLHLNLEWLIGREQSLQSQKKVLEDRLVYASYLMKTQAKERDQLLMINRKAQQKLVKHTRAAWSSNPPDDFSPAALDPLDLAIGKPFSLSSSVDPQLSQGRVCRSEDYFFATKVLPHQSITIDLEDQHPLAWLVIFNRRDADQGAAQLLYWGSHNGPKLLVDELLPVDQPDSFTAQGGEASVTPLFGARGRYFTVYSPLRAALHFAELRLLKDVVSYQM